MSLKTRLERQLKSARQVSEGLLADFKSPADWTRQVHPDCNHALWFVGHMAITDNFFVSLVAPEKAKPLDDLQPLFGMGSQPTADPAKYPPPGDLLSTMRDRRAALLDALSGLTDEDLAKPMPAGTPAFLSDVGSVFEAAVWHEGLHSGQLTITRRSLGHQPLMKR